MKRNCKSKLILYLIIVNLAVTGINYNRFNLQNANGSQNSNKDIISDLKGASGNYISIITPENVTYVKPMYGYYPGTNSFEHDENGCEPEWFNIIFTQGGTARVINTLDGHYKVLELHDTSEINNTYVARILGTFPTFGTIEYWMRTDDAEKLCGFHLNGGVDTSDLVTTRIRSNQFQYWNGTDWNNVSNVKSDVQSGKWYNIRINFECSSGGYQGLNQYTWNIYINGFKYGNYPFANNRNFASVLMFYTDYLFGLSDYSYFIDAIGLSWDSFYTVGDNVNLGIFLDFRAPSNLTWIGYSLDGTPNRTILGSFVLPFPNGNGFHKIQLFGTDSEDNVYQSDERYFEINKPSLLMVHGLGGNGSAFDSFYSKPDWNRNGISDYIDYYGSENLRALESYYDNKTTRSEFDGIVNPWSPIENISRALKNYIINDHNSGILKDNLDLIGYSLGGYVIRYMIKEYYYELRQEGISVQHASILGTPNHGEWGDNRKFLNLSNPNNFWTYESSKNCRVDLEMVSISEFLTELNADDETPYNILYNTYRGTGYPDPFYYGFWLNISGIMTYFPGIVECMEDYNATLINKLVLMLNIIGDSVVPAGSVPLSGAVNNRVYYLVTHGGPILGLNQNTLVLQHILWDLRSYLAPPKIEIDSPQNKTYTEPMSGYYPATFGFENDEDGQDPKGWVIDYQSPVIEVISELYNHKKVLRLSDTSISNPSRIVNSFSSKDYGTIELWIQQSNLEDDGHRGQISGRGNGNVIFLVFMNGDPAKWQVRDNGVNIDIVGAPSPLINTWYHIRIDFEYTTGGYQGLSEKEFYVYIDGTRYGPYLFSSDAPLDEFRLHTYSYGSGYDTYFDAVGFSWDPNYNIGDNLNEGLLIGYNSNIDLDWRAYSLDNQANKTILGNYTIQFPEDGIHNIQIFGNDSYSDQYKSNLIYFSIDTSPPEINVISPSTDQFFGNTPPNFQISFTELNLDLTWYYLGPGTNEVIFSGFTGVISQTEWNKLGDGSVSIRFYINDTGGWESFDEVIVQKDITAPTSIISFTPYIIPNIVTQSTLFTISPNDGTGSGVFVTRYKINDSSWYDYTNPFALSGYSPNYYLITYQAIDEVGNEGTENTILVILTEIPTEKPPISGFNIFLILSLIGLVSLILIKKYKK